MKVYKMQQIERKIDVEAEKIYLVKAIHDIDSEKSSVAISSSDGEYVVESFDENKSVFLNKELSKLKEYNILDFKIEDNSKILYNLANKFYRNLTNDEYIINDVYLLINEKEYKLGIESKTGKLLYIFFYKENLKENESIENIMRNYVKYLDLYIIDDWKFESNIIKSKNEEDDKFEVNILKSEKADLIVTMLKNEGSMPSYLLSITSSANYSSNFYYK
ncbi:MAG: hypothetical protein HFJ45_04750 [Clostridia bacterium]|nr:hypothetical protein [Clostridia bacterium]